MTFKYIITTLAFIISVSIIYQYAKSRISLDKSIAAEDERENEKLKLIEENGKKMPIYMCLETIEQAQLTYFPEAGYVTVMPKTGLMACVYAKAALRYCMEHNIDLDYILDKEEEK